MGVRPKAGAHADASPGSERAELLSRSHTSDDNTAKSYTSTPSTDLNPVRSENYKALTSGSGDGETFSDMVFKGTSSNQILRGRYGSEGHQKPINLPEIAQDEAPKDRQIQREQDDYQPSGASHSGKLMREPPTVVTDVIRSAMETSDQPMIRVSPKPSFKSPSTELFMNISKFVSPSTNFGSSSSQVGIADSTDSVDTQIRNRHSQRSLRHASLSNKPSMGTLFLKATQRFDSSSSFYPSPVGSECQSLQDSTIDVPGSARFHGSSTMPRRNRGPTNDLLYRARSSISLKGIDSPGFSKFSFPWEGGVPVATVGKTRSVDIVHEEDNRTTMNSVQKLEITPLRMPNSKPQKRTSSNRALTGMLKFVKSGVTGEDYSSSSSGVHSPHDDYDYISYASTNNTGSTVKPGNHRAPSRSGTPRSVKPRSSWYSKPASVFRGSEDEGLTRNSSNRERHSGLRRVDSGTQESLGRFDHIGSGGEGGLKRAGSLTLKKSFTTSIAKIKEKVSIGGFRTVSQAKAAYAAEKQRPESSQNWEDMRSEDYYQPSQPMATIRSSEDVVLPRSAYTAPTRERGGNSNMRRINTVKSLPSRGSGSATRVKGTKKGVATTYDDCVIFPFAGDGLDENDGFLDGTGGRFMGGEDYQGEEYESERRFWRTRSVSMAELSPKGSVYRGIEK